MCHSLIRTRPTPSCCPHFGPRRPVKGDLVYRSSWPAVPEPDATTNPGGTQGPARRNSPRLRFHQTQNRKPSVSSPPMLFGGINVSEAGVLDGGRLAKFSPVAHPPRSTSYLSLGDAEAVVPLWVQLERCLRCSTKGNGERGKHRGWRIKQRRERKSWNVFQVFMMSLQDGAILFRQRCVASR